MHCVPFLIIDPYFEQFSVCKWGLYSKLIWCSSDRISHVFDSLWEIHCETSLLPWQRKRIRWTLHNIRRRYARNIYIFLVTEKMEEEGGGRKRYTSQSFPNCLTIRWIVSLNGCSILALHSTGKWFQYLPITSLLFIIVYSLGNILGGLNTQSCEFFLTF